MSAETHPSRAWERVSMADEWNLVASMPKSTWCETMREGEKGFTESMWVLADDQGGREYWDRGGYSTLVNPGSFAPPTHWRPKRWGGVLR